MNPSQTLAAIAVEYASLLSTPNALDYPLRYAKIAADIREVSTWLLSQPTK